MVRLLRRIFRPKTEEVITGWKSFPIFTLRQILFGLIFWIIKSKTLRWAAHVTLTGEGRNVFKILVGNLSRGDCLGYQGVGSRIMLKCIFKE
jgi:hypothetical protein